MQSKYQMLREDCSDADRVKTWEGGYASRPGVIEAQGRCQQFPLSQRIMCQ